MENHVESDNSNDILASSGRQPKCCFCPQFCVGCFKHVLCVTETYEHVLKPILMRLLFPGYTYNGIHRYPTCATCRRFFIETFNIPECCFEITPNDGLQMDQMAPVTLESDPRQGCCEYVYFWQDPPEEKTFWIDPTFAWKQRGPYFFFAKVNKPKHITTQQWNSNLSLAPRTVTTGPKPLRMVVPNKLQTNPENLTSAEQELIPAFLIQKPRTESIEHPQNQQSQPLQLQKIKALQLQPPTKDSTILRCPLCLKAFPNNRSLNLHLNVHIREKPYQCNVCNMQFPQPFSVELHLRNVHGFAKYECDRCSIEFRTNKTYMIHLNLCGPSSVAKFHCERCEATFPFHHKCPYTRAGRSATRPHRCHFCRKTFKHPGGALYHMNNFHKQRNGSAERSKSDQSSTDTTEEEPNRVELMADATDNNSDVEPSDDELPMAWRDLQ
ncbi:zinc finger protein 544-like [Uranotaenia lowii]|uniref:zinc finger protein 544-like n=1 Tax=Uranotaenia lowii TaxID=190385 RepID=UPI002478CA2A|nr:zinc finger protein 544-like [Uranotaenia lowii]